MTSNSSVNSLSWKKLLCKMRISPYISDSNNIDDTSSCRDGRSEFVRDYDRIAFSSAFRRLRDKTQVFPLSSNDNIHNRLTHSLEVSSVGKSLVRGLKNKLSLELPCALKSDLNEFVEENAANIVSAACLGHDIGNPPFGHSGESAMRDWWKEFPYREWANGEQFKDFEHFEGNATGLRRLKQLKLTAATLATYTKYPATAQSKGQFKKNGVYNDDVLFYTTVAKACGLCEEEEGSPWKRHPLSFIVEAADDICYRLIDLEDSSRLSILSRKDVLEFFSFIIQKNGGEQPVEAINDTPTMRDLAKVRSHAISALRKTVQQRFVNNYQDIMKGKYFSPLLDDEDFGCINNVMQERVYRHRTVLQIEILGCEVIKNLMTTYVNAFVFKRDTAYSKKIREVLPEQTRMGIEAEVENELVYVAILKISDYVFGMTDTFALNQYRNLAGVQIPQY